MALPYILPINLLNLYSATATATDTDSGDEFDPSNVYDYRTHTFWKAANSTGTKYLTFDIGSVVSVTHFAFAGHNLEQPFEGVFDATISLEYSSDNFSSDVNEAVAGFDGTSGPTVKSFAVINARYWRMKIVPYSGTTPYVGIVHLGTAIEFPTKPKAPFTPQRVRTASETLESKSAHLLGSTILNKTFTLSATFMAPSLSFMQNTFKSFWDVHGSERLPFFWVLDEDESTNSPLYVRLAKNADYYLILNDYQKSNSITIPMQGIYED